MTPAPVPQRRPKGGSARPPAVLVSRACLNRVALEAAFRRAGPGELRLLTEPALLAAPGEDGAVLVPVADPVRHIAAALAEGAAPLAALEGWIGQAREILRLRRQISRRVVLLEERAWAEPSLAPDLALALGQSVTLPTAAPAPVPPPMALVHATALIAADPDLAETVGDWRALTLGALGAGLDVAAAAAAIVERPPAVAPAAEGPDATDLLEQLAETQSDLLAEATARLQAREAEAAALLAEAADRHVLKASTEALERRLAEARARADRREVLLAGRLLDDGRALAERDATIAALHAELAQQRQAAAALGQELDQQSRDRARALAEAEDRLRLREAELAQAQADLASLQAEAQTMRDELDRIHGSKSWRLTEPLRAGRRLLGG